MTARCVVVSPTFPHPPTSGGTKRTLRLLETIDRAGVGVRLVAAGTASAEDRAALVGRGWDVDVVQHLPPSSRHRIEQHLRRHPVAVPVELRRRLRAATRSGTTFGQLEHPHLAGVLSAGRAVPWVLSTQNVDSALGWERTSSAVSLARNLYQRHRLRHMEERAAGRAVAVLCVSDEDAAYFERFNERVIVAPNGVDHAFFEVPTDLPSNDDVLFFGHFSYGPNLEGVRRFLVESWPRVVHRRPSARLLLAGPGSELVADAARAAPSCVVLGLVDDLPATIAAARAIVVPVWRGGGTRLKAIEALASGRPVAGTKLGMSGLGAVDGAHCLQDDAPGALADAVVRLLDDPLLSQGLAERARALAQRFEWTRALAPAEDLYRSLARV